jgi:hypothetical protein
MPEPSPKSTPARRPILNKHAGQAVNGYLLQGLGGTHHGLHFDPMPEQHDVHEGCQLPEEHLAGQSEYHGAAIEIGGGDGDGDQRHHPRAA